MRRDTREVVTRMLVEDNSMLTKNCPSIARGKLIGLSVNLRYDIV